MGHITLFLLDGVAMGSPLGPALADIFVGFHESRLSGNTTKPGVYFRYVDDTFVIFGSEFITYSTNTPTTLTLTAYTPDECFDQIKNSEKMSSRKPGQDTKEKSKINTSTR